MKKKKANPHQDDAVVMSPDVRNFRWAYALLVALAKEKLKEMNKNRECLDDWPAGQEWKDLGDSSKSIFLQMARETAGINDDNEFLIAVRNGNYDIEDLYDRP